MLRRLIIASSILFLVLLPLISTRQVQAAALTTMSDTMTRLQTDQLSSHDILITLAGANTFASGNTIQYDFDEDGSDFVVANASWVAGDFDFNDGTERVVFAVTQGAAPTDACTGSVDVNDVGVEVDTDDGILTVRGCGSMTASGAAPTINFEIGTSAGGTNRITNPDTSGSTTIPITETTDSGTLAVPIMSSDQVTVSATVDPTITSTLSSSTCLLGTLSDANIQTCTYTNTVNTNATSGFTSTILDDGNLRVGANDINDAAGDNDVDAGSEEYGASTSDAGNTIVAYVACADPEPTPLEASALTTSAQSYSTAGGPVSADVTTVCHGASITATTPAGSFSHITTHITTGIF